MFIRLVFTHGNCGQINAIKQSLRNRDIDFKIFAFRNGHDILETKNKNSLSAHFEYWLPEFANNKN